MSDGIMTGWGMADCRDRPCRRLWGCERGAALILVLWVTALLSLVMTGFAFSMRVETDAVKNFRDHAQALHLAESGVMQVLADLANATPSTNCNVGGGPAWPIRLDGRMDSGRYQVIVTTEDGKISLNHASEHVLKKLLQQTGVLDAILQDTIAAAIVDWRDPDEIERPNGAESGYYQGLPVPYASKNAPFQRIEELLSVRGMTKDILYGNIPDRRRRDQLLAVFPNQRTFEAGELLGLAAFITAHGSGRVDYSMAAVDVLAALDVPESQLREILVARESAPGNSRPKLYHIESFGRLNQSPLAVQIVVVVAKEGTPRLPRYRVLAWQEQEG